MYSQEDLEALELFNAKAEKLKKSAFTKFLCDQGSWFKISWDKDERVTIERRWPDEEATEAFILTLRFFVQNNEQTSFENMEKTYDSLPMSQQKQESFKNIRKKLNEYLDSESPLQIDNKALTHRHIFDVFIYGQFAHANKTKKAIFDRWMSYPLFNVHIYNDFVLILGNVMSFIATAQNLNREAMKELGAKR